MTHLTYSNQLRTETDDAVIANLLRKGWVETTPPDHNDATQHPPTWVDGQWVAADLTADEIAAKTRKTWLTSADFIEELTLSELAAVQLSTNPTMAALRLILAAWSKPVWSDDPRIQLGISTMVSEGLITTERSAEILAQ